MAKKSGKSTRSTADALVDDLSKQVKKLSKQLKVVEQERDALAAKISKQKAKAKATVRAVEKKLRKELKKTQAAVRDHVPAPAPEPAAEAVSSGPDDSWTVARLRAEARAQHVTGYSRMTKSQLLVALL